MTRRKAVSVGAQLAGLAGLPVETLVETLEETLELRLLMVLVAPLTAAPSAAAGPLEAAVPSMDGVETRA